MLSTCSKGNHSCKPLHYKVIPEFFEPKEYFVRFIFPLHIKFMFETTAHEVYSAFVYEVSFASTYVCYNVIENVYD